MVRDWIGTRDDETEVAKATTMYVAFYGSLIMLFYAETFRKADERASPREVIFLRMEELTVNNIK